MEKNRKLPPSSYKAEETTITWKASRPSKGFTYQKMENTSSDDILRNYSAVPTWATEAENYFGSDSGSTYPPLSALNNSNLANFLNAGGNETQKKMMSCQWEAAQHGLFQFSNMCFLTAFIIPRNYKTGILMFRVLLCLSFVLSAIWASVHFCALDWFIWSSGLAVTNGVHVIVLSFKFLPPALSLELTELYIRLFKPLKVNKKHFKELTKEACLLRLAQGESYAIEEVTPADEKLSVLLKGRLKVSCNEMFLHNVSSYQFIDSLEWQANTTADGTRFQVTITAEEDCLCLTWCRLQLDRIFRHRPQIKFILNNLIGKDITQKMYSLNEQVGHMCTNEALSRAARDDHWRRSMNRSVSVDAVNTGTQGYVRSAAWKQAEKYRKNSTHSETETSFLIQPQAWYPFVASQFPAEYPFVVPDESVASQDEEKEPMLAKNSPKHCPNIELMRSHPIQKQQLQILSQYSNISNFDSILNVGTNQLLGSQSIALIPVIVPVIASAVNTSACNAITTAAAASTSTSRVSSLKRQRGVKFDETRL